MSKTLVIHPADRTTDFLEEIYLKIPDCSVIRGDVSESYLMEEIGSAERVYMLGHGTPQGLIGHNRLIINEQHAMVLKNKGGNLVSIWCNADCFVTRHGLQGLYTGMIVSEPLELKLFIAGSNYPNEHSVRTDLMWSNRKFAESVQRALEAFPPEYAAEQAREFYLDNGTLNAVIRYNSKNIYSSKAVADMADDPRFEYKKLKSVSEVMS